MKFSKEEIKDNKYIELLKKYWIPIAAVFVAILVAVSFTGIYRDEVLEIDPEEELIDGEHLYLAAGKIDTLNPIVSKSEDTYYISKLVYGSLFTYTEKFNVAPELVSSYSVDTKKGKITLKLKTNITWHNGKKLTAKDVNFTVNAIRSYGKKGIYYDKISKIKSVSVKGNNEVIITFNKNNDCALDNLVFPIVYSNSHSSINAFLKDTTNFKPVGTGQYQYSKYNHIKELTLIPNKSYDGNVAKQNIYIKILPKKSLAYKQLETYAVTCYYSEDSDRKNVVNDKEYKMYDMISNDVEFIAFNTKKAPFNDKTTRQAAAYAIDAKKILEDGYVNDGVISNTVYYPGFLDVAENNSLYNLDMDKAKELLKEKGYEDRDSNGILEDSNKKNVSIKILVNSNNANRVAASKIVANDLKNIGFNVEIKSLPWEEYLEKVEKNEFDILMAGYETKAEYDLRILFNGDNLWGYSNDSLLAKATELEKLYTVEEYTEKYIELKTAMLDEMPYYTLCYRKMGLIGVKHFEANSIFNFDNVYKNCGAWKWKKVKVEEDVEN